MRYIVLTLPLWGLLVLISTASAADKLSSTEKEQFKSLAYKLWTGWDSLDPSKVADFYSKDPNNVYFDISPLKFKGWSEYAEVAGKSLAGAGGSSGAVRAIPPAGRAAASGNRVSLTGQRLDRSPSDARSFADLQPPRAPFAAPPGPGAG